MPRRPAIVTQAEIARAIRAAKREGATGVEVKPDGTVLIRFDEIPPTTPSGNPQAPVPAVETRAGEVLY